MLLHTDVSVDLRRWFELKQIVLALGNTLWT